MRTEIDGPEPERAGGAGARRRPRRLSQLFARLSDEAKDRVTIASILDALGDRSFAALLVLFAAFNLIPLPPPSSAILGLPLLVVAAQLTYGSKRAWLPKFMAEKSISAEQFRSIMDRVIPRLVRLEEFVRPRYWPFWRRRGDRIIGVISLALAVIVTLPIPLGNWLPAFSVALLGLALSERDGILLAVGGGVALASIGVVTLVFGAATAAVQATVLWMF
ncbi:exopolysaccharide biosynthesis protein [Mesorhizobium sp. LHD-90]|uniref:exopolysaccharide biosynthesis protein n=1 Tax=Mesorhizobium sp. LHD-90 TaxID=3071414 RepID=UPI0027E0C8FA|nr:exopolysaccharide biosynthesis protein [Mesorhizobium sp. LHD-90]MDQ6433007.1 exopolysaccharide biosynthesis protein [Mesorhizobium sp. LHD-90]